MILDIIQNGASIEFQTIPDQETRPETYVRAALAHFVDEEVQKFLAKGIIVPTEEEEGDFYSTREKRWHVLPHDHQFEANKTTHCLSMDTPLTCMQLVTEGAYLAAMDLKDTYYSIKVRPEFQKYLKFIWRGHHYKYVVMAMSLAPAP